MPLTSYSFNSATAALQPLLATFPPVVVAIDGRLGSGKTTLGRYLAWHFNMTLIETDLYLEHDQGFVYRLDEIRRAISHRVDRGLPVFVEGAAIGSLLEQLGHKAAFTIYVSNIGPSNRDNAHEHIEAYEVAFRPVESADLVIELSH